MKFVNIYNIDLLYTLDCVGFLLIFRFALFEMFEICDPFRGLRKRGHRDLHACLLAVLKTRIIILHLVKV